LNQIKTALRREIKNTPHKDGKSKQTELFKDDEITKTNEKNRKFVKSLIQLGYKKKQLGGVIFESKLTLNHPSDKKKKKEGDD